jgi:putative colanic acid biosynthesis UDP-glucose lipid carrier transferase
LSWLYPLLAIIIKKAKQRTSIVQAIKNREKNESFWCYKFRSMYIDNVDESQQARG